MKKLIKLFAAALMVMTLAVTTLVPGFAATKGDIGSSTECYIQIDNKLIQKKGKQYATVKIKTYQGFIIPKKAPVQIELLDGKTRKHIITWRAKGGDKISLGDDHRSYILRVKSIPIQKNTDICDSMKASTWKITSAKDCTIK